MRPWLVLSASSMVLLLAACAAPAAVPSVSSDPAAPVSPSPAASEGPPSLSPAPSDAGTPLADRLEAQIEVPGSPDWPLAAFGSIWVLAPDLPLRDPAATPNLVRIDPATNEVVATIPLPDRLCQGFTASDDAIWVCAADALVRIDPTTNAITTSVPIKGAGALSFYQPAFGGGYVWALGSTAFAQDTVIRLDPATNVTTTYPMSGPIGGLAYGFDALWLTDTAAGTLTRLDPTTGQTEVLTTGLATPRVVAAGSDSLWVSLYGGQEESAGPGDPLLARIDPATGQVLAEFTLGDQGGPQYGVELWAGEGGVLVRSTKPWLARIDEATNEVVETITAEPAIQGPVTFGAGSIWTVNIERDSVFRIEP